MKGNRMLQRVTQPLTVPSIEHVRDEVVDEGDLGLGDAAGVAVKHRHHHGQPLSLLLVCL